MCSTAVYLQRKHDLTWLDSLQFEKFGVKSFWNCDKLFIFKILDHCIDFQNIGVSPASAKLTVKYRPGRWNTGHLATLLWLESRVINCDSSRVILWKMWLESSNHFFQRDSSSESPKIVTRLTITFVITQDVFLYEFEFLEANCS